MLFCGERTVLLVSVHHWKGTPRIALSQNISEAMMDLILAAGSVWNCVSAQCWQDDWTKVWVCNCQSIGQKHLFCFHLWLFHTTSVWVSPLYLNLWTIRGFFWQVFCYFFGFVCFVLFFLNNLAFTAQSVTQSWYYSPSFIWKGLFVGSPRQQTALGQRFKSLQRWRQWIVGRWLSVHHKRKAGSVLSVNIGLRNAFVVSLIVKWRRKHYLTGRVFFSISEAYSVSLHSQHSSMQQQQTSTTWKVNRDTLWPFMVHSVEQLDVSVMWM